MFELVGILLMSPFLQEKVDVEGPEGRVGNDEPPTEAGAAAQQTSVQDEAENRGEQV